MIADTPFFNFSFFFSSQSLSFNSIWVNRAKQLGVGNEKAIFFFLLSFLLSSPSLLLSSLCLLREAKTALGLGIEVKKGKLKDSRDFWESKKGKDFSHLPFLFFLFFKKVPCRLFFFSTTFFFPLRPYDIGVLIMWTLCMCNRHSCQFCSISSGVGRNILDLAWGGTECFPKYFGPTSSPF